LILWAGRPETVNDHETAEASDQAWLLPVWGGLIQMAVGVSVVQGSGGGSEALGDVRNRPPQLRMPILPFKLNQDRRRHIPRQQHKVTNWPAYDASLRQRGSLTVWFTDDAIAGGSCRVPGW